MQERGQAEQLRALGQPGARRREVSSGGSPDPPASDRVSGLLMLCRAG